ncbi:MAG TPA: transketolase C-terminal domain-containing protein [Candidatus Bathyarchaeia archaeon]|nr:transketolase C-terminal domain-containing protein [Candidatus Bathyarchaeia archaeon]
MSKTTLTTAIPAPPAPPLLASMRDSYAETLLELGAKDPRIVVLGADTSVSIKTNIFGEKYPERFFNVGIAEANMVGIASGLALAGKIPFVTTYSAFVPGKCLDQIRNAVAYPNLNVKIVSSHGGLTVGPDGASHQTVEDVAAMRAIPRMNVVIPADGPSTRILVTQAARTQGPFYIRLSRPSVPTVYTPSAHLYIGKLSVLREGADVGIIACGIMANEALEAAKVLAKDGVSAEVVDSHTIKPLDHEGILKQARKTGVLVTCEEQNTLGGLGGAVAEAVAESYPVRVVRVGIRDSFGESGEHVELMAKYGLTSSEIVRRSKEALQSR